MLQHQILLVEDEPNVDEYEERRQAVEATLQHLAEQGGLAEALRTRKK